MSDDDRIRMLCMCCDQEHCTPETCTPMDWRARCLAAEARIERLREVLGRVAVFLDPNVVARYDALAEIFYRATGVMAPGKSVPLEMASSQPPDDARATAYKDWLSAYLIRLHDAARENLRPAGAESEAEEKP